MPIHPELARRFDYLEGITSLRLAFQDSHQRRQVERFDSWSRPAFDSSTSVREEKVSGPHGAVPVRIYSPPLSVDTGGRACLIWMHGGGFVGGTLDMAEADWTAREVCQRDEIVVVSVDYRLAVSGVRFPVPFDDVAATITWVVANTSNLGVDRTRISIGGASAGGNLAAAAALSCRETPGWDPAGLILAYPALYPTLPPARTEFEAQQAVIPLALRTQSADVEALAANYIGSSIDTADGRNMPGLADLEGLCPVLVIAGQYDDLRPSCETFVASLASSGVEVQYVISEGMLHGFLNIPRHIGPVERSLRAISRFASEARTETPAA